VSGLCEQSRLRSGLRGQSFKRPGLAAGLLLGLLSGTQVVAYAAVPVPGPVPVTASVTASGPSAAISLNEYRARLQALDQLIAECQRAMIPANCRSDQVGPDVRVVLPFGNRSVHFDWLRGLLDLAANDQAGKDQAGKDQKTKGKASKDEAGGKKAARERKQWTVRATLGPGYVAPTLAKELDDARKRLAEDAQWAGQLSGQWPGEGSGGPAYPAHAAGASASPQRSALSAILAASEYHTAVARRSLRDRLLEKVGNWINRVMGKLVEAGSRSKWIGITAEAGFLLLICVALVWFLIRLERQGRFGPAMIRPGAGLGAASARDWQLWLEDAREAASSGAWRDAIHLLYWASISRLESSGLWPADRARTPREYLALLARENTQHAGLSALTRSFERTWYAGRPATQADFQQAEQFAAQLGARPGTRPEATAGTTSGDSLEAR
jgi:hypothetical protein